MAWGPGQCLAVKVHNWVEDAHEVTWYGSLERATISALSAVAERIGPPALPDLLGFPSSTLGRAVGLAAIGASRSSFPPQAGSLPLVFLTWTPVVEDPPVEKVGVAPWGRADTPDGSSPWVVHANEYTPNWKPVYRRVPAYVVEAAVIPSVDEALHRWAAEAVRQHLDSPEVKTWVRSMPDATAEEVLGYREDWTLVGGAEERDLRWRALLAAARELRRAGFYAAGTLREGAG
jgi:hypothetical protein